MKNLSHKRRSNLLLVCYYFPPLGMGGVQRAVLLSSHLAKLGWSVTVLTVKPFDYPAYDSSVMERLPRSVRIVRAVCLEQELLGKILPRVTGMRMGMGMSSQGYRVSEWLMLPDSKVFTIAALLRRIETIVGQVRPSVVITSSPPPSIHLVGLCLRKYFGVKWIADYRDVWFSQSEVPYKTSLHRRIHRSLQNAFIRYADRTVVVSDGHLRLLDASYGKDATKVHLIPNGYDEKMFAGAESAPERTGAFRVGYCGTLNRLTYVPGMFETLIEASGSHPLSIDVCGIVSADLRADIDKIDPYGRTIHLHGYKQHREAVQFRMSCDANLVTLAPGAHLNLTVPGKAYETLRTPRPVIGIVPRDCSAWRLLSRFDNVTLVNASSLAASRDDIACLIRGGRVVLEKRAGIDRFSWDHLAGNYDQLLREVTA